MFFATWNIRTLMDSKQSDRPERRSAIIARELRNFKVDIAGLAETRFPDEGQLREEGGGYTFFWKGKPSEDRRIHGVGFAIKNELLKLMPEVPVGINERIMTLQLKLDRNQTATVISAYAPTLDSEDSDKELFYSQLDSVLSSIPSCNKVILLGDFNARVGRDHEVWPNTIGKEGVGNCNSNGLLLLTTCREHNLIITNTLFRQKDKFKTSWQHPRSRHWHLIDYIIVRCNDRKDVLLTRSMTSADDCWTDHRLIRSKIAISIAPRRRLQKKNPRRKFNTTYLQDPLLQVEFVTKLEEALPEEYQDNIEEHWDSLKNTILDTCASTMGFTKKKHQDWFDENDSQIKDLIDQKRKSFQAWRNDPDCAQKKEAYHTAKGEVQRKTRTMKNEWWVRKAKEMQSFADNNNSRAFFIATKEVYGPSSVGMNPLTSKDGSSLLKDTDSITSRWREHFSDLLNLPSTVSENTTDQIPLRPTKEELAAPPTLEEVEEAIQKMKNNKAAGPDGIPAEIFKAGGPKLAAHVHALIEKIWQQEEIPCDLRDALIVTIFKKGDKSDCGNYRGISLLSIAGKILARILAVRLQPLSEEILPESQCGFRPSRGTVDAIFTARQLQEKSREQHKPLYMAFIDLSKAFDMVNRHTLWKVLLRIGCPEKFIRVLRLLHDDMTASVLGGGDNESDPFTVGAGVKQGCVIAPTLFSIYISCILHLAENEGTLPGGIDITYRVDGGLFRLSRLKARRKIKTTSIMEIQYADDNAIFAQSESDLQAILTTLAKAYRQLGLILNTKKTKVLYQPSPSGPYEPPRITVNHEAVENVEEFPHLGSIVSTKANIDAEVRHRISCASAAFGKLRRRVFENKDILVSTKILVYKAVILPTLLYASESWTVYARHLKQLEKYHQRCLRRILQVTWEHRRTNSSILEEAECSSIESLLIKNQLRWTGHVLRMPDSRLPKQILFCELSAGQRSVGGQQKRFKDNVKADLKKCNIDIKSWESLAQERSKWRQIVHDGCMELEINKSDAAEMKRERRKRRAELQSDPWPTSNKCPHCKKVCGSRIGLFSHMKTH